MSVPGSLAARQHLAARARRPSGYLDRAVQGRIITAIRRVPAK